MQNEYRSNTCVILSLNTTWGHLFIYFIPTIKLFCKHCNILHNTGFKIISENNRTEPF